MHPNSNPIQRLQEAALDTNEQMPTLAEAEADLMDVRVPVDRFVSHVERVPLAAGTDEQLAEHVTHCRRLANALAFLNPSLATEWRLKLRCALLVQYTRQGYHPVSHGVLVAERARGAA